MAIKNYILSIILILPIVITLQSNVFSHPHVRLLVDLEFEFKNNRCTGFWIEWRFDDYFSASLIHELDKDKDGFFNNKEISLIYKKAFMNLKNYGYFVFLRKGKNRKHPHKIEKFTAWQKENLVLYKFFIPLDKSYGSDFHVAVFDRTYYCSIQYQDPPAIINLISGKKPVFEIAVNKEYPIYYNPLGAEDDMKIYKKWKPGLQKAYPEEIHVFFRN